MDKIIKNKVSGCSTANISSFNEFQGGLKEISKVNLEKLKKSIIKNGITAPLFIWKGNILDGHQRKLATMSLIDDGYKIDDFPFVEIQAKTEKEARQILLTYVSQYGDIKKDGLIDFVNNSGLNAIDLEQFTTLNIESNCIDITEDDYNIDVSLKPKAKNGDIYQLGDHRLMCGDSTNKNDVEKLMNGVKANMCFSDPPYNVDYKGGMSAHKKNIREGIKNDKMDKNSFYIFCQDFCKNIINSTTGAIYICMSSSELDNLKPAFQSVGGHWQSFIIWVKNTFTLSRSDWQNQYEPILYGWNKEIKNHFFKGFRDHGNVFEIEPTEKELLDFAKNIIQKTNTDIWRFKKPSKSKEHPTMKPLKLCEKAITSSSNKDEIVLDLFGGSGSTLIACEQTKRKCYMMELDEKYIDIIIDRWEKHTNKKARKIN